MISERFQRHRLVEQVLGRTSTS